MMASYQPSLFDAPAQPVLTTGSGWIAGLVSGSLAVSLCVIAIALLGMLMLSGRLPLRRGLQVVLGCFLLLGSAQVSDALMELTSDREPSPQISVILPPQPDTSPLPPVVNDPYAGASLKRN